MLIIPCLTTDMSTDSRHCYAIHEHLCHEAEHSANCGVYVHYLLLDSGMGLSPEEFLLGLAHRIIGKAELDLNL